MAKKLYKSRKNRLLAGVCGGIAEYFDIDATIVRLIFVLLSVCFGGGIILYIVAAIIMPSKDENPQEEDISKMKSANVNPEKTIDNKTKKSENRKSNCHSDEDFDDFFKK